MSHTPGSEYTLARRIDLAFQVMNYNQGFVMFVDGKANTLLVVNSIILATSGASSLAGSRLALAALVAATVAILLCLSVVFARHPNPAKRDKSRVAFYAHILQRSNWSQYQHDLEEIEPPPGRPRLDALGASTFVRPTLPIAEFISSAAAMLGTTGEEIRASGSGREMTRRRQAATLVGVEQFRYRVAELAAQFGRAPSVVSRWGVTAARLRLDDAGFREQVAELAAALTASSSGVPRNDLEEAMLGADPSFVD